MTQTHTAGGWNAGKTHLSNAARLIAWLRLGKRTRHFLEAQFGLSSYTDEVIKAARIKLESDLETIEVDRYGGCTYYSIRGM